MVPSHLIATRTRCRSRRTANATVTRCPLPCARDGSVEAPHTETERELAAIWQRVLRLDAIGRDDDFFALGGHSLLATQANAQANLHWSLITAAAHAVRRTHACTLRRRDRSRARRTRCHGRRNDAASAIDALLGELETQ